MSVHVYTKTIGYSEAGFVNIFAVKSSFDLPLEYRNVYETISNSCDFAIPGPGQNVEYYLGGTFVSQEQNLELATITPERLVSLSPIFIMTLNTLTEGANMDIYGVCTSPQFRSITMKGAKQYPIYTTFSGEVKPFKYTYNTFSFIIDVILTVYPTFKLSLGVLYENPYYDAAIKIYASVGFHDPQSSKNLPTLAAPGAMCRLVLNAETKEFGLSIQKLTVEEAIRLKNLFLSSVQSTMIEIEISKTINDYMKDIVLKRSTETGFSFILEHSHDSTYKLKYVCAHEVVTPPPSLTARVLPLSIIGHSHPYDFYPIFSSILGWPSAGDGMAFLRQSIRLILEDVQHVDIIVSAEGYYFKQSTDLFINLVSRYFSKTPNGGFKTTSNIMSFIFQFTLLYFMLVEDERDVKYATAVSKSIFLTQAPQKIGDMFKLYVSIIDKIIDSSKKDQIRFLTIVKGIRDKTYISGFIDSFEIPPLSQFDILYMCKAANDAKTNAEFIQYLKFLKVNLIPNYISVLEQVCASEGIPLDEPLFRITVVDDFIVNPELDKATVLFFNYNTNAPGAMPDILPLEKSATMYMYDQLLDKFKEPVGNMLTIQGRTPVEITNMFVTQNGVLEQGTMCDPTFYTPPPQNVQII